MGLLYTKLYLDFDSENWVQIANDPAEFRAKKDNVALDVEDTSHVMHRLMFQKGNTIRVMRVTGKFRLHWDDQQ